MKPVPNQIHTPHVNMKEFSLLIFHRCFIHILYCTLYRVVFLGLKEMSLNLKENVLVFFCQDIISFSMDKKNKSLLQCNMHYQKKTKKNNRLYI